MRISARGFLTVPWSGALLALLAAGIVTPAAARAGCLNPHVVPRSQHNAGSIHLELLGIAGALPTPQGETPRPGPAPCSGAMCSGNPATPLSTIPSVPPPDGEQWAFSPPLLPPIVTGPLASLPVDATLRPVERPCSIFHPPRFQSALLTFDD